MTTEITQRGAPIHSDAQEDRWVDFTDKLEIAGRTLTGTPVVTEYTITTDSDGEETATLSNDWTVSGETVNAAAVTTTTGIVYAIGMLAEFNIVDAGTVSSGTEYRFKVSCGTTSTNTETLVGNVDILCSDS